MSRYGTFIIQQYQRAHCDRLIWYRVLERHIVTITLSFRTLHLFFHIQHSFSKSLDWFNSPFKVWRLWIWFFQINHYIYIYIYNYEVDIWNIKFKFKELGFHVGIKTLRKIEIYWLIKINNLLFEAHTSNLEVD